MKRNKPLYHILFWLGIYFLWVLFFRSYSVPITKTMTIEFCYLIFIMVDYYAVNNLIVPQFLVKKRYLLFALFLIVLIAISAWLRALVAIQMNLHFFSPKRVVDIASLYLNSVLNISLWVLVITTVRMIRERIETQQEFELLEKERTRTELDYLKAQINPHALFNSLNTIYGHIDKSNQLARNTLLQFSELLRYQLYDCSEEKVSLQKEIAYLDNYVGFQRLRKDEQLQVNMETGELHQQLQIAPLLLVVLIENAFKFVSNFSHRENRIDIKVYTKGDVFFASIRNTTEPRQISLEGRATGIGLSNLKRRLELLYPQKHTLTIHTGEDFYQAHLMIDLL
ncbi:MAG: histidine kinase [Bacteroidota bacterium]